MWLVDMNNLVRVILITLFLTESRRFDKTGSGTIAQCNIFLFDISYFDLHQA